jgi:hypothetical protein
MVLKFFKLECIWYLFRGLEVIEKKKKKKMGRPVKAHEAQSAWTTLEAPGAGRP